MDISLLTVPIMYGCDRNGTQYAPKKLREKNLVEVIKNQDHTIYDFGNLFIPKVPKSQKYTHHKHIKYLKPVAEINSNLAHLVYSSLCSQSFPFIVGGDHSLGLGSISGASRYFKNLAVIWIDAHGDINTHETSPSGNSHGMPLASALGIGVPELTNVYYEGAKVKPENVYIIGARDLDKGEIELAKDLNLNLYTMDIVKKVGIYKIVNEILNKIKNNNVDGVHLSFDIDALDKSLVPGTGTPVDDGFNIEEIKKLLEGFLNTEFIKSMDFVEFNPELDENDITTNLCMELINWIFKILK